MGFLTPHQQSALDYSRHISLTANAGSGKTFVLSKRYLQIAINENIPLRNIAAITFTDKAAGELYKKVSGEIDSLTASTTDDLLLRKLERIRRQLVSANISTIHSFCIDILREYPVEAQLDANFTPIDQIKSDELIEMSVEEVIRETLNSADAEEVKSLVRLFSSKNKLSTEIASLIRNRKNVLDASAKYEGTAAETAAFFYDTFLKTASAIMLPRLESILPQIKKMNDEFFRANRNNAIALEAANLLRILENENDSEKQLKLLDLLRQQLCTRDSSIKKRGYITGAAREDNIDIISDAQEFFEDLKCFVIPDNHREIELELASAGKRISDFFLKCLTRYEIKKKEEGNLDYEDLLICTKNLLQNEQVQISLGEKFRYIMVDEYQDTNDLQYGIFLPILDYLKKNNLFVVGDEKQSIYMFRDAELEVFTRTKKDITNASGESSMLSLPDTFRMAPALCAFTNILFKNLFSPKDVFFNEVPHSDIICAREGNVKGSVEVIAVSKERKEEEAELAARRLITLTVSGENKWGDIAVLCRKRKSFAELERAFVKYRIPYSILGGKGYYQRQSVYDIYNYFAFLLDNQNDASLAGILRSPFFNVSDAELFQISLLPGNSFWNKFKKYAGQRQEAAGILKTLEENILLSRNYELTPLLRKILNESGYHAVLASGAGGVQESANMNKLIRLTTDFFSYGNKTLYDYVNFLKDAIQNEEDEAQAAVSEESDSVKIMTVHQAKGLEYPVVLLFKSNETSKKTSPKSKEILVDKKWGLLTKVPLNNDYFRPYHSAPILNLSSHITGKKTLAEIKRLFYVAVTRAKDKLIISTVLPERQKKDSFTGLLSKGIGIDLTSSEFRLSTELRLLKQKDGRFVGEEENIEMSIPVTGEIEEINFNEQEGKQEQKEYIFNLNLIKDTQKGEIISATKFSVYKECPLKYNLIYQYGFSELHNLIRDEKTIEFIDLPGEDNEEAHKPHGDIKGSIIHKILQQELQPEELSTIGIAKIRGELKVLSQRPAEMKSLEKEIINMLSGYYSSPIYRKIKSYSGYDNEFNIYLKEKDYFLYGIIDKFIRYEKKGIIIDYKTDDIKESEIRERSAKYFNQLKFYSYIIKSAFKNISEIELRIVYLKYPEKDAALLLTPELILETGRDINLMVQEIRAGTFRKDFDHCRKCYFSINNAECIIN